MQTVIAFSKAFSIRLTSIDGYCEFAVFSMKSKIKFNIAVIMSNSSRLDYSDWKITNITYNLNNERNNFSVYYLYCDILT